MVKSPLGSANASSGHKTKEAGLPALSAFMSCQPVCFVLFPLLSLALQSELLWQSQAALTRQTRQVLCAINPLSGSAITNSGEHRSCLGRVFNSKLGYIATLGSKCMVCMQPLLKLKTQPRARSVS